MFYTYPNTGQRIGRLQKEIAVSLPSITHINSNDINIEIHFPVDLSVGDKTVLDGLVSAHVNVLPTVKIKALAKGKAQSKHFHNIDYTKDLTQSLYPKRTFVQGELQKVEWFADQALTDKILQVDISYIRDSLGFAVSRTTTRTWYRSDGSAAPETKVTDKLYTINLNEQIVEGHKRRQNIVDGVQIPVMGFLMETQSPALTAGQIVLLGRDFLNKMEPYFDRFVKNSSSITDTQDPNFGKKEIVVEFENNIVDTWLDDLPTALGGATIRQWLIGEFSI